jgi:NADH-quinone oxidoreductase subunit N
MERVPGPGGGWYFALAVVGALNTAVALYYYARVIRAMFLETGAETRIEARLGQNLMLGAFSALVLVFGIWWAPMVDWSARSLEMLR